MAFAAITSRLLEAPLNVAYISMSAAGKCKVSAQLDSIKA